MRANQKKQTPGKCNGDHKWIAARGRAQPFPLPSSPETGAPLDVDLNAEDCVICGARRFV